MKNDLTLVIERTALIENLLDQAISKFVKPRKEAYMYFCQVVLDSSIMDLGSKVKATMAISEEIGVELNRNALHTLIGLRNAFVHHDTQSHVTVVAKSPPEDDEMHYMLDILKPNGKIDRLKREDAFEKFNKCYDESRQSLKKLLDAIRLHLGE